MKNRGFAITGILYSILVLFLILLALLVFSLQSKKTILDRLKSNTMDEIEGVVKGKSSDNSGPTMINATIDETHKGIVYLDPTDLSKYCDESNSVSTTETKTGCMKWYIFNDSGDNYTMILDHNTTARIKWNDSNSNVAYESSNLKAVVDDLVTTSKWEVTPRLITADEVNTIVGGVSTWNVNDYNTWFYFEGTGTKNQTTPTYDSSNRSSYDWLYNNLTKCKDHGCTIEDSNTYSGYGTAGEGQTWAYWTSTPVGTAGSGSDVWYVIRTGVLNSGNANTSNYGVRPVITIAKETIKKDICPYEENHEFTFDYTGSEQTFTVPCSGNYKIEVWGAQGGRRSDYNGFGAYVSGNISLSKNSDLYVYVGAQGNQNLEKVYNGGGAGAQSYDDGKEIHKGFSGGGATDIRLTSGAWDNASSLRSRIMVAGGGGGSYSYTWSDSSSTSTYFVGERSHAGGLNGYSGATYYALPDLKGLGGTQISGGSAGTPQNSTGSVESGGFGYGGSTYSWSGDEPASGGGGGYYGGGAGAGCSGNEKIGCSGGNGGGGSSYISGHTGCVAITSATNQSPKAGCTTGTTDNSCSIHYSELSFTNTKMIDGTGYNWTNVKGTLEQMPKPSGGYYTSGTGNTGNGYAKITYLGK